MISVQGKSIVLTGTFPISRSDAENKLKAMGARTTGTVSAKTDMVFAGDDAGSKLKSALSLGVTVFDSHALMGLLNGEKPEFLTSIFIEQAQGMDPETLTTAFGELNWDNFEPLRDLWPLRKLLLHHEAKHGVSAAHRFVSEKLAPSLKLWQPDVHVGEILGVDISPDGRFLAVGSWCGGDYDAGGFFQLWDLELGRALGFQNVRGGVGWPGSFRAVQWRPDGKAVGMAFDTNGVGEVDPWEGPGVRACTYMTNGWDSAPGWTWSPVDDVGNFKVFVSCWGSNKLIAGGSVRMIGTEAPQQWCPTTPDDGEELSPSQWVYWIKAESGSEIVSCGNFDSYVLDGETLALKNRTTTHAPQFSLGGKLPLPRHPGAKSYLRSIDGAYIAAVVPANNDEGARSGIAIYQGTELKYQLETLPVRGHYDHEDWYPWAFSPDGTWGACLTTERKLELWELKSQPSLLQTIEVPGAMGLLWSSNGTLIVVGTELLAFYRQKAGELSEMGRFDFGKEPATDKPLEESFLSEVQCLPVQQGDTWQWSVVFSNGAICGPGKLEEYDALLAWSVAGKGAWPLRWHPPYLADEPSALVGMAPKKFFPAGIEATYKPAKSAKAAAVRAPKKPVVKVWPPVDSGSWDDIFKMYLESLPPESSGWGGHADDSRQECAVVCVQLGRVEDALALIAAVSPYNQAIAKAHLALYLAKYGYQKPALALIEEVNKSHVPQGYLEGPWHFLVDTWLAGAFHLSGDIEQADIRYKQAHKRVFPENNQFENVFALAQSLALAGRYPEVLELLMHPKVPWSSSPSFWYGMRVLALAFEAGEPGMELMELFYRNKAHNEFSYADLVTDYLLKKADARRLFQWLPRFDRLSMTTYNARATQALYHSSEENQRLTREYILSNLDRSAQWPNERARWLLNGAVCDPRGFASEVATELEDFAEANQKAYYKSEYVTTMVQAAVLTGHSLSELEAKIPEHLRIHVVEALIGIGRVDDAMSRFTSLDASISQYDGIALPSRLGEMAWALGLTQRATELFAAARASARPGSKDLDLAELVMTQARAGDLSGARDTVQEIPKGKRKYRIRSFIEWMAEKNHYAAVCELLKMFEPFDMNGRPQQGLRCLRIAAGVPGTRALF